MLSSNPSNLTVQKCLQNVADDVTSRIHAKHTLPKLDMTVDLAKKLNQPEFSSLETAGNKMNNIYIKPSAFNFNTMSRGNISCPAEAVNKMNHVIKYIQHNKF
ncbi:hypothetical protein FWK35_00039367 [Aphis craccivora]|uniref:Uncharacterized protein n=1 Tax=Aphis craccivora TaxID=307492 RepID=A0A6G0VJD6_APHCR|nr:hypothetical protein FWK35_00039367 [Aphis craccivora]